MSSRGSKRMEKVPDEIKLEQCPLCFGCTASGHGSTCANAGLPPEKWLDGKTQKQRYLGTQLIQKGVMV